MKNNLIIGIVVWLIAVPSVSAIIDPFDFLEESYHDDPLTNVSDIVENWRDPNMVGADGYVDGEEFVILWDDSWIAFFDQDDYSNADRWINVDTVDPTGVALLPDNWQGPIVISDSNSLEFFDMDGTSVDGPHTITGVSGDIMDVCYDQEKDRLLVISTSSDGPYIVNEDWTTCPDDALIWGHACQVLDFPSDPDTYDMVQFGQPVIDFNSQFVKLDYGCHTPFITDLGTRRFVDGIAYTQNHLFLVTNFPGQNSSYYVYPRLPFRDDMQENVAPFVNLTYPLDDYVETENNTIVFGYTVDDYVVMNCSLFVDDGFIMMEDNITIGEQEEFQYDLDNGEHTWYVECVDGWGLVGTSETWNLTVQVNCIPTVSEWGMAAMTLLVLAAGTVVFRRRLKVTR